MDIIDKLKKCDKTAFSFEVLPPLKGTSIDSLYKRIDTLTEFNPQYINITTHHSEPVYLDMGNGLFKAARIRRRPGTVAVAAALQQHYKIPVVPHVICSGFTREETEYALIDLQILGLSNLLLLRGDKGKEDKNFKPTEGGNIHTTELEEQVNLFNSGKFIDGDDIKCPGKKFTFGVACYPEKHEEAPNLDSDIKWLKRKVELGAKYAVTQMFFDNEKYYKFVDRVRAEGIDIPIIPAIKPIVFMSQFTVLPKVFHCDLPNDLVNESLKCKSDDDARELGVEWSLAQCKDLIKHGVPSLHFFTMLATDSVRRVAKEIY